MTSAGLALLLVASQPPGMDGGELRRAFERAYLPMLEALAAREGVRVSMHWSGSLLEWMELHAPDALDTLLRLVRAGRVEPIAGLQGGGLLPALPERDVAAQVHASLAWWRERAGVVPRGVWLPHFGWDPAAARILGRQGVEFTVLEEGQLGAPVPQEGHALTEREGVPLAVFAADAAVAAMVPDEAPSRILRTIDARARAGARLLTLALPIESFGAALDSSATRCFGGADGWVHTFFRALEDAAHWLKLVSFGMVLDRMRPSVRVYPPASVGGAVWRGMGGAGPAPWEPTLAAHPEVNLLHKRMLRVSASVDRLARLLREQGAPADDPRVDALADATRALWKGQDAAAYVLGPEVGAQDAGVRHAAWSALLRAEYAALSALESLAAPRVEEADHDCDGRVEVLVSNRRMCALVDPGDGGALVALDAWTLPGNLLNVPTRRPAPGHAALRASSAPADAALAASIQYDRQLRAAFVDHFLPADATVAGFAAGVVPDVGDFAGASYEVLHRAAASPSGATVLGLGRDGNVSDGNGLRLVRVLKRYAFARDSAEVEVRYEVANRFHDTVRSRFAVELDLGLDGLGPDVALDVDGRRFDPKLPAEHAEHGAYALVDEARGWRLVLRSAQPMRAWHAPVTTVNRTPRGTETCAQGVCLLVWWPIELYAMDRARFDLTLTLEA